MKKISELFSTLRALFEVEVLPNIGVYDLGARPQRNVKVGSSPNRIKGRVYNGRVATDFFLDDGTVLTVFGNSTPKQASEVVIDAYDMAYLDAVIGTKWRANEELAKVMKWHWLAGRSAKKIEEFHRSKSSGELQSGYSTRNAANFVKAFYLADDQREADGKPRQRSPKDSNVMEPQQNSIEADASDTPLFIHGFD